MHTYTTVYLQILTTGDVYRHPTREAPQGTDPADKLLGAVRYSISSGVDMQRHL